MELARYFSLTIDLWFRQCVLRGQNGGAHRSKNSVKATLKEQTRTPQDSQNRGIVITEVFHNGPMTGTRQFMKKQKQTKTVAAAKINPKHTID